MNSVSLVGNLCTEVELRELGDGKKVATFLLAVSRPGKDADADFVRVSTWERQAELCAEYLTKGRKVGVEGRLRSHSWDDDDGKRHTRVDVNANRVEFLWRPERAEQETPFEAAAVA